MQSLNIYVTLKGTTKTNIYKQVVDFHSDMWKIHIKYNHNGTLKETFHRLTYVDVKIQLEELEEWKK